MLKLLLPWRRTLCVYVSASATLTDNILHVSAAWILNANNPVPQILNWLLNSQ